MIQGNDKDVPDIGETLTEFFLNPDNMETNILTI